MDSWEELKKKRNTIKTINEKILNAILGTEDYKEKSEEFRKVLLVDLKAQLANEEAEKVAEIISFVRNSGGMAYAKSQMENYQNEAFTILNEFPENSSRDALGQLIRFTTERKK